MNKGFLILAFYPNRDIFNNIEPMCVVENTDEMNKALLNLAKNDCFTEDGEYYHIKVINLDNMEIME